MIIIIIIDERLGPLLGGSLTSGGAWSRGYVRQYTGPNRSRLVRTFGQDSEPTTRHHHTLRECQLYTESRKVTLDGLE